MNISLFKRTVVLVVTKSRAWWIALGPLGLSGCRYSTGEYVTIIDVGRRRHFTLSYQGKAYYMHREA